MFCTEHPAKAKVFDFVESRHYKKYGCLRKSASKEKELQLPYEEGEFKHGPSVLIDTDNQLTIPFPSKINALIRAHGDKIMAARAQQQHILRKDGKKISIDEYASDHWFAQVIDLDIDNLPTQKPRHLIDSGVMFQEIMSNVQKRKQ